MSSKEHFRQVCHRILVEFDTFYTANSMRCAYIKTVPVNFVPVNLLEHPNWNESGLMCTVMSLKEIR